MMKWVFLAVLLSVAVAQDADTDEDRCEFFEFDCGNGECVDSEYICDGTSQCSNGADEAACDTLVCEGTGTTDDWCNARCNAIPPNCPVAFCSCETVEEMGPAEGIIAEIVIQGMSASDFEEDDIRKSSAARQAFIDGVAATAGVSSDAVTIVSVTDVEGGVEVEFLITVDENEGVTVSEVAAAIAEDGALAASVDQSLEDTLSITVTVGEPDASLVFADDEIGSDDDDDEGSLLCRGSFPATDDWCDSNCNHIPAYCPSSMCTCGATRPSGEETAELQCVAANPVATDAWCQVMCNSHAGCPDAYCDCGMPRTMYRSISPSVDDDWCNLLCNSGFCPSTLCSVV